VKRRLAGMAVIVLVILVGCAAISHLSALQPQQIPASPPVVIPVSKGVHQPAFQRGIDVDAYTSPQQNFSAAAAAVVAYARSLNANSISISFPFFMTDRYSSQVFATSRTPSPDVLALLVEDAERAGLYVSIRPLLSESNIGGSRVYWKPADPAAWFASYQEFLLPYAQMAQHDKVGEFIVGAEFAAFGDSPRWTGLDRAIATVFHGTIGYSNNDTRGLTSATGGLLAFKNVDAYHRIWPPFLPGWQRFDRQLPSGTVLTEVGISAYAGAWRHPWVHRSLGEPLAPMVQAAWFTAACKAAMTTGLRGIYFWTLPLSTRFASTSAATPGAWANSPGAAAIARCFGGHVS
jgi:hypothetical protein